MLSEFKQFAKKALKEKGLTYALVAANSSVEESSIKRFMCGVSDSRRVAEIIADAIGCQLVYNNGAYSVIKTEASSTESEGA